MAEYIERGAAVAVLEERQKALCPVGKWSRNQANDREKFDAYQELITKTGLEWLGRQLHITITRR